MQAVGVTPPVLNLKSLTPGRAEAYPAQDPFQSLFQQRIVSRGLTGGSSSSRTLNRTGMKSQLREAQPSESTSPLLRKKQNLFLHSSGSKKQEARDPISLNLTRKSINRADRSQSQEKSATSPETVDSSSRSWKRHLRSRAMAAQCAGAVIPPPATEMSAALKGLIKFLNQQPGQNLKVSPDQVPEVKEFLLKAGLPAEQVDRLLNSPSFEAKGLTASDLQGAWQEACQSSQQQALAIQMAQGTQSAAASAAKLASEMPPALKGLVDFLNQQPGQNLKVPPDRLPELAVFLQKAGISPEQVEQLLNSPRFQEQGLTATDVQSAWQSSIQSSLQGLGLNGSLQDLTSQSDYRQMWENLTLPPQALADLRLELQQLGVPPEALANLNPQNFPQGISLTQVWQFIQQVSQASAATAAANDPTKGNANPKSPQLLNAGQDLEKWRQLLVQSGMDQELAQVLVSGSNPTNREELRTSLMNLAPPPNPPSELEVPKPLYLPESVRVRTLHLFQQQLNAGQGGSGDGSKWAQNFEFSPQVQGTNFSRNADLNNFLALITGGDSLKADQLVSSGGVNTQNQSINAFLTPEAREALWSQVQNGILGNLRPGENQVTLTLNPPEMGKLHLTLNVKGEMVEVTAISSHPAVAEAGTAGVQQLAQALNQQGLILTQFQFHHQDEAVKDQTNFAFSQTSGDQRQTGKKDNADKWEQPTTPRRRRGAGGIDCFA